MACTTGCPIPQTTPTPSPLPILVGIAVLSTVGSFLLTRPRSTRTTFRSKP